MCNVIASEGQDNEENTGASQGDVRSHPPHVKWFMYNLSSRVINPVQLIGICIIKINLMLVQTTLIFPHLCISLICKTLNIEKEK